MLMTDVFSKKESEKFIISHVGHIHVAYVVYSSLYAFAWMPEHLLCTQLLQLSHITAGSLFFYNNVTQITIWFALRAIPFTIIF